MPATDPATFERIAAALDLMDRAMKKFCDAFNAGEHYSFAVEPMEAEGRQLLRAAYRDAPELIEWLPDMHAALNDPSISFAYRSDDDEAVRQAHARLAAERAGGVSPA